MPKTKRTKPTPLSPNWREEALDHLNGGEGEYEIPETIHGGKPNEPVWIGLFEDWVVGVIPTKSTPFLEEYGVVEGVMLGYAIDKKVIC